MPAFPSDPRPEPPDPSTRLRLVHRLALVSWILPLVVAVGLFTWAAVRTPRPTRPADFGDLDGVVAFLAGVALLIVCVPYAIVAAFVRTGRRWAVIALASVSGIQGLGQLLPVVDWARQTYLTMPRGGPGRSEVMWLLLAAGYTVGLIVTAYLGTRLAIEMSAPKHRPGGFAVVPVTDTEIASPTKRAA